MKYLVTGGAGFLGYHLCKRLLEDGHQVVAVDDFCTGTQERSNELKSYGVDRFVIFRWDVCELPYRSLVPSIAPDRIFHLACPASPKDYKLRPLHTLKTGFLGTLRALEAAEFFNARIVLASTSEVYGDPEISPQPETYWGRVNPVGPRACYDEGKRAAEALAIHHAADLRIARIFNTYGPGMRENDGRAVPSFVTKALRGETLELYGDGTQTRSFCYVDDLVGGLMTLMDAEEIPWHPPIVNLGNPQEVPIAHVAGVVAGMAEGLTGRPSEVRAVRDGSDRDDPRKRCPDITRARRLGWEPKISLPLGLLRTVEWFYERGRSRAT